MTKTSLMKKTAAVCVSGALAVSMFALAGCSDGSSSSSSSSSSTTYSSTTTLSSNDAKTPTDEASMSGIHHAVIEVEGYDPINVELNADSAPITVTNFAKLVNDGYYNGLTFYRIQDGFVIQGGTLGNTASGTDDSLTPVVGEFSSNGHDNALADEFGYGTIAMARTSDPDSATSTFFITLDGNEEVASALNGMYAAFGTIDEAGMEVVKQIVADHLDAVDPSSAMGIISDESQQPVIKSITIVD